jgi:ubiquitin-activating enzyme E1-like protein
MFTFKQGMITAETARALNDLQARLARLEFDNAPVGNTDPVFEKFDVQITAYDSSATGTISGVTNTTPAVIDSTAHGLLTGQVVTIASVGGATGVNGNFQVTVVDANHFSVPVAAGGAYTSGGTWTLIQAASWTEQFFDPNSGVYVPKVNGRAGTNCVMQAYERNGNAPTVDDYYELTRRMLVGGVPIYEYDTGGSGGGSSLEVKGGSQGSGDLTGITKLTMDYTIVSGTSPDATATINFASITDHGLVEVTSTGVNQVLGYGVKTFVNDNGAGAYNSIVNFGTTQISTVGQSSSVRSESTTIADDIAGFFFHKHTTTNLDAGQATALELTTLNSAMYSAVRMAAAAGLYVVDSTDPQMFVLKGFVDGLGGAPQIRYGITDPNGILWRGATAGGGQGSGDTFLGGICIAAGKGPIPALGGGVPAHDNSTGTVGMLAWDGSTYLYYCVQLNTWIRWACITSF